MPGTEHRIFQGALLATFSFAAVLLHLYHPYVEDAEIYVPGIKRALNPALYLHNDVFFTSHAHLTFFRNVIAASCRISTFP
jgi:hypothetical protein